MGEVGGEKDEGCIAVGALEIGLRICMDSLGVRRNKI